MFRRGADGRRYTPTGPVFQMWNEAGWKDQWSAVQGPRQWRVANEGTLVEIADRLWQRTTAGDESEDGDPT